MKRLPHAGKRIQALQFTLFPNWPRDHLQDIEAHLSLKAESFAVQQLAMWQEIVAPKLASAGRVLKDVAVEVEAAEEAVVEAGFREVVARMASDEADYSMFKLNLAKAESRAHIAMVQYIRALNAKGVQPEA